MALTTGQEAVGPAAAGEWEQAKNILCVRLDSAGDVLMTTPALRALKESKQDRTITLLTSPAGAAVARLVPVIDRVLAYDAPWVKNDVARADSRNEYAMVRRLRKAGFDAAVIFCVFSQNPLPSAFLCHLADIPLRLAYCRENPYRILTHWVPDPEPKKLIRHEVERQLDLVRTIGCRTLDERIALRTSPGARRSAREMLSRLGIGRDGRPIVVIHPGATAPSRRYPAAGFAEVGDRVAGDLDAVVLLTGSVSEREVVEQVRSLMTMPSRSLAGMLDVEQLCGLISLVDLVITNNTGPAHIAAAVGTRVVDLYALTNPQHTPWKVECRVLSHDVPCRYCYKSVCPEGHHNCLRLITPETVAGAASALLNGRGRASGCKEFHVYSGHQRDLS